MAKIIRKTQKIFANNNPTKIGQFGSAQLSTPTTSDDLDVIQALAAYENGWNDAVINGEKRPPLEEFNGLKYVTDSQIAYLFQEGIAEYDDGTMYFIDSIVKESGTTKIYTSLTDNNISNALTVPAEWQLLGDLAALSVAEKTVVTNYTVLDSDNRVLIDATSGNITITLPAIIASFKNKSPILLKRIDNSVNTVTIEGTASNYEDEGLNLDIILPLTKVFAANDDVWRSA